MNGNVENRLSFVVFYFSLIIMVLVIKSLVKKPKISIYFSSKLQKTIEKTSVTR